ncbi:hypothetical protein FB451DRAFT_1189156 [Mycena latifolia]|nr:hypothetical protein FB451DRAFT_1189156 [Mycena latifolia]
MAGQSKLSPPSSRPRTKSVPKTAAAAARHRDDKENEAVSAPSRRTVPAKRPREDEHEYEESVGDPEEGDLSAEDPDGADEEDEGDDDFDDGNAAVAAEGHAGQGMILLVLLTYQLTTPAASESEEEDEHPIRAARVRRLSEKEAQRLADKEEAAARKVSRATTAAKKQRRWEVGDEPVPLPDTVFTSRELEPQTKKTKTLQQRNARVPATQARAAAADTARGRTHEPIQDLHHISINGHVFPAHVQLDLRASSSGTHAKPSDVDARPRRRRAEERRPRSESRSPSRSPAVGDKRACSPTADDDTRTTQAQKINDHEGRPRAKDYDDMTRELIAIASTWYRCLLAAREAFPDVPTRTTMVNMAWGKASEELKVVMPITPDIAKLITRRGSQMRGELKTKVRGLVELVFGFESGQNQKIVRKNRQLAEDLKEGMGYCYKEFPAIAAQRRGMYKAKIIQRSSNLMWFNNRRDEGAMHPELFGPVFPKPAFALVLTAIECSVDEWATGIKTDVAFTSADYRSVYLEHLKCLDEFEKHTAPRGILTNILTRMHNLGRQVLVTFPLLLCAHHFLRFHSGAQPIAPIKKASLSKAVLDAAIREYDEDDNTETDGEDGEHSETA